jgi:hypothetical protein
MITKTKKFEDIDKSLFLKTIKLPNIENDSSFGLKRDTGLRDINVGSSDHIDSIGVMHTTLEESTEENPIHCVVVLNDIEYVLMKMLFEENLCKLFLVKKEECLYDPIVLLNSLGNLIEITDNYGVEYSDIIAYMGSEEHIVKKDDKFECRFFNSDIFKYSPMASEEILLNARYEDLAKTFNTLTYRDLLIIDVNEEYPVFVSDDLLEEDGDEIRRICKPIDAISYYEGLPVLETYLQSWRKRNNWNDDAIKKGSRKHPSSSLTWGALKKSIRVMPKEMQEKPIRIYLNNDNYMKNDVVPLGLEYRKYQAKIKLIIPE